MGPRLSAAPLRELLAAYSRAPFQFPPHIVDRCPQWLERHENVIDEVGRFFGRARRIAVGHRRDEFGGLLTDLLQAEVSVGEQPTGVSAATTLGSATRDRPIESRQLIAGQVPEAADGARMTRGPGRPNASQHGVSVAIGGQLDHLLDISAGGSLVPRTAET